MTGPEHYREAQDLSAQQMNCKSEWASDAGDAVMNRQEHLEWAKTRALEYANRGDTSNALASIASDLNKHPETRGHSGVQLMAMLAINGEFNKPGRLAEFIKGFQ